MAGRSVFTAEEATKIRSLLHLKARKDRDVQKGIRDKLRKLGFYISDLPSAAKPYTVADFDQHVRSGVITIIG